MEATAEEVFNKLRSIKEEADLIEMRVVNTRKHVEHAESELENMKHVLFKGFHTANEKINQMEQDIHALSEKVDLLLKNLHILEGATH